ncbi:MAG: signal peptidase I [Clostridiales bacterium]|nr:signal peptidase I [Clostridiales bacterium]
MLKKTTKQQRPELSQLRQELERENKKGRFRRALRSTLYSLVIVAAAAVLVATLWMPVLRIYGNSMTPTLSTGSIVVSLKGSSYKQGDIIAMYYGNKLLVKRCVGTAGDWIDIDRDGNVFVNSELLEEPYLTEKAFGECNIELPYQVPENSIFVLGDHRATSIDSRNTSVGSVDTENVVGKIVFCIWPLSSFGIIK